MYNTLTWACVVCLAVMMVFVFTSREFKDNGPLVSKIARTN